MTLCVPELFIEIADISIVRAQSYRGRSKAVPDTAILIWNRMTYWQQGNFTVPKLPAYLSNLDNLSVDLLARHLHSFCQKICKIAFESESQWDLPVHL